MSGVYGIAGFVDGFIQGRETRNRWDDRKRDQKRQDRLDTMEEETHARRLKAMDQQIAATDKAVADQSAMDKVFADSVDAAKAAEAAVASSSGGAGAPSAPGSVDSATLPIGVMPLGLPGSRSGEAMMRRAPAEKLAAEASSAKLPATMPLGLPARGPVAAPASLVEAQAKENARVPTAAAAAAPNKALYDAIERKSAELGLPSPALPAGPSKTSETMYAEGRKRATENLASDRAAALDVENLRRQAYEDGPVPLEWRREAATKLKEMGYTTNDGGKTLVRKDAGSPRINLGPRADAAPPPKAAPPANASPQVKALAQSGMDALAETTTPAMQAAAESASMGLPKASKGKGKSEAAAKKYSADFIEHYIKVGSPMVIEALLKRGEFEKATKFQEFIQNSTTQKAMQYWSQAAFAVSSGDMDGFAENSIKAYNLVGYFDDDTTLVADKSGFTKDKAGNITGARLTFRDETNGNEFDQIFDDPQDLINFGITMLAPEQAFEHFYAQQQAAAAAALGVAEKAEKRADKDAATEAALQKRVDTVAKDIMEAANDPLNGRKDAEGNSAPMSYAEARAEAEAILRGGGGEGGAAPNGPPVAYRPPA